MTHAIQNTQIIPILVTLDWTDVDNAVIDITNSLHASFPGVWAFPCTATLLLTVIYDGTDSGVLVALASTLTGIWLQAVVPTIGEYVYLVDIEI
jgi:hypothetical protein